ncbi:MAG: rRNA maturation RNase YbeY [Clostridia bacterium]|nr:rRNA maturation RNase YbeY [Clostridia bacterium]
MSDKGVFVYNDVNAEPYGSDFFEDIYRSALKELKLPDDFIVELSITSADFIRTINADKRGIDKVTDVLSFPSCEFIFPYHKKYYDALSDPYYGRVMLGEILICRSRAEEQAEEYGHSLDREMGFLFAHGLMHLFGYDHVDDRQESEMTSKVESTLSRIGLVR